MGIDTVSDELRDALVSAFPSLAPTREERLEMIIIYILREYASLKDFDLGPDATPPPKDLDPFTLRDWMRDADTKKEIPAVVGRALKNAEKL